MKNYGLATLTFVVGVTLGVIIGLLVNGGDDTGSEALLRQVETERDLALQQLGEATALLDATEAGRQEIEQELEEALDAGRQGEAELMAQLEETQRELERLMEETMNSGEEFAAAREAVAPHIFMLEQLDAYAAAGFDGTQFVDDPATRDALGELPAELALVIRQLFAEPDATTAEVKYRDAFQQVLNSLQAAVSG
jgi:hypothetical protein